MAETIPRGSMKTPPVPQCRGLLVLLCGLPGCGKDLIGRTCAQSFPRGAALSQDEHGGDATRACAAAEKLLRGGRSPIFILRNGVDAADRLPYVDAARRNGYRVVGVLPEELSCGDDSRWAALWLAAVAGCYERLRGGGDSGHETLTTAGGDNLRPAKVCLSFLRAFRAPCAPGEVDCLLRQRFLLPDLDTAGEQSADAGLSKDAVVQLATELRKTGRVPEIVARRICSKLSETQALLAPFGAMRRPSTEIIEEVLRLTEAEMQETPGDGDVPAQGRAAAGPPSKGERQSMQRLAKVREAVEHLVSPANLASCRPSGSTVTQCMWFATGEGRLGTQPAWPASYFCGSPKLRRLRVAEAEVLEAAHESSAAVGPLQQGENGIQVEVLLRGGVSYVAPVGALPKDTLWKLGQPSQESAA